MTFIISLTPYFTIWVGLNINSIPAETMFGLIFVTTNIFYILSLKAIYRSNPYNKKLQELDKRMFFDITPLLIIFIGFILTYTIYRPGIYVCCLIAILIWIFIGWRSSNGNRKI